MHILTKEGQGQISILISKHEGKQSQNNPCNAAKIEVNIIDVLKISRTFVYYIVVIFFKMFHLTSFLHASSLTQFQGDILTIYL